MTPVIPSVKWHFPQYDNLATVPFIPNATTDIAYFRFHGRNKENWLKKGIETSLRYAYLYSDDELKEFIPSIRTKERIFVDGLKGGDYN